MARARGWRGERVAALEEREGAGEVVGLGVERAESFAGFEAAGVALGEIAQEGFSLGGVAGVVGVECGAEGGLVGGGQGGSVGCGVGAGRRRWMSLSEGGESKYSEEG